MLEAANADLVFTISLKRSTPILLLSTNSPADYPIYLKLSSRKHLAAGQIPAVRGNNVVHRAKLSQAAFTKINRLIAHFFHEIERVRREHQDYDCLPTLDIRLRAFAKCGIASTDHLVQPKDFMRAHR